MKKIPRDKNLDSTLPLFIKGYPFLYKRFKKHNTDIFRTRFMGQKAICLHGEEASKIFFNEAYMKRHGAVPKKIQNTLMGRDSIHMQDDAEHKHRKSMFLSLMTKEKMQQYSAILNEQWQLFIEKWEKMDKVVLMEESKEILTRSICSWSGVPLKEKEVKKRTQDFWKMIDAFGGIGLRHFRGKSARNRSEKWMIRLIRKVRSGKLQPPKDATLNVISMHRGLDGNLMDERITAVELLNSIRPAIAVCTYIAFIALALDKYPQYKEKLLNDEDGSYAENFVNEVRRFYPFVPVLGAITRKQFEWMGYKIKKDSMTIMDVYGTLHDEQLWERSAEFFPDHFKDGKVRNGKNSAFDLIPQGGGFHNTGHRCPGEWVTIESMKVALDFLVKYITYDVPEQNLKFSLKRMPSFPKSKFIMSKIKRTGVPVQMSKLAQCPFHIV